MCPYPYGSPDYITFIEMRPKRHSPHVQSYLTMTGNQSAEKIQAILRPCDYLGATFDDLTTAVFTNNAELNKAHCVKERNLNCTGLICNANKEAFRFLACAALLKCTNWT